MEIQQEAQDIDTQIQTQEKKLFDEVKLLRELRMKRKPIVVKNYSFTNIDKT